MTAGLVKGGRLVYQFKCEATEIHGKYHVHSMILWESSEQAEWVAGDVFTCESESVPGETEHDHIVYLIQVACARISQKVQRTLF
jgi:hypothetical protein